MIDYNERPILIFWETTRACKLKCRHCRAEAILNPLPDELSTEDAFKLIDMIKGFGRPYPVLILTGGDPIMREDLFEIIRYAKESDIPLGIAPAVSDLLTEDRIKELWDADVKYVSISLDGASPEVHDYIRGIEGNFNETIKVIKILTKYGFKVQINTLVSKETVYELPYIAKIMKEYGINIWELFFLIKVGRGIDIMDLTPNEYEDVINFLYEASRYGFEVRTVEAPFYRRIVIWRREDDCDRKTIDVNYVKEKYRLGKLYEDLTKNLIEVLGEPYNEPNPRLAETRDGKGVIFIAYNGDVYPSGFAPYKLGNIKTNNLVNIYRENNILRKIRSGEFNGRCRYCRFKDICGGSRARAYAEHGDILGEDPACIYNP